MPLFGAKANSLKEGSRVRAQKGQSGAVSYRLAERECTAVACNLMLIDQDSDSQQITHTDGDEWELRCFQLATKTHPRGVSHAVQKQPE